MTATNTLRHAVEVARAAHDATLRASPVHTPEEIRSAI
jgi:hypothetical protein